MLRTPHVDSLAREGVGSPLCVPARLSLVTGLYPHNSNLWQNDATCPLDADTFMNRLRASGYRTCSIGKNHLYPMEKDLYAHEDSYRQIGFDHIEDMSGTWGDHAKQIGLHRSSGAAGAARRLTELPESPRCTTGPGTPFCSRGAAYIG